MQIGTISDTSNLEERKIQAKILTKTQTTPNSLQLEIELSKAIEIKCGQHIAIVHNITQVMRPYTPLTTTGVHSRLELAVKVYPSGLISGYLSQCEKGDYIQVVGPLGTPSMEEESHDTTKKHSINITSKENQNKAK